MGIVVVGLLPLPVFVFGILVRFGVALLRLEFEYTVVVHGYCKLDNTYWVFSGLEFLGILHIL